MSAITSSTDSSNPVDERQPLLESHTANAYVGVQPSPQVAVSADGLEETRVVSRKVDFWSILWYLAFATFGGVILAGTIKGFLDNGDIEVCIVVSTFSCQLFGPHPSVTLLQFDFKKALLRALGGGLSGATGTNILCSG